MTACLTLCYDRYKPECYSLLKTYIDSLIVYGVQEFKGLSMGVACSVVVLMMLA